MEDGFYYVDAAGKRQGPFGINQLRGLISPNTLVWTKGMTGWVSAGQIPALAQIFPVPTPAPSAVPQKKGANVGLIVALVLAVVVALGAVGYIVYSNHKKQQEPMPIQETYTESTEEQPVQEDKGYTGSITCLATLANTLSQWIFMWMLMAIFRGNTPTPNMAIVWTLTALIPPTDTYLSKSANRDKVW